MLKGAPSSRKACQHASMPADAALATSLGAEVCTGWQKSSGYDRRALAEAAMSRRQATEVAIDVRALNRMLERTAG